MGNSMKKLLVSLGLMFSLSVLSAPSFAGFTPDFYKGYGHEKKHDGDRKKEYREKKEREHSYNSVPEIDAAGAAIALALLGGIVSIARERRKR